MSRRDLAEYYISRISEEYPALVRQPQGFLTMALIRACGDLQREKDVLEKVLRGFIETDAGRALSIYRKAVIEGSPAPMPKDAVSRPETPEQGDAPDDQPPSTRATAPEASDGCEHVWPEDLLRQENGYPECLRCGLPYDEWTERTL